MSCSCIVPVTCVTLPSAIRRTHSHSRWLAGDRRRQWMDEGFGLCFASARRASSSDLEHHRRLPLCQSASVLISLPLLPLPITLDSAATPSPHIRTSRTHSLVSYSTATAALARC